MSDEKKDDEVEYYDHVYFLGKKMRLAQPGDPGCLYQMERDPSKPFSWDDVEFELATEEEAIFPIEITGDLPNDGVFREVRVRITDDPEMGKMFQDFYQAQDEAKDKTPE